MEKYRLAIVIPAFNEDKTIGKIVDQLITEGIVIVVDDSSTDKTPKIARKSGAIVLQHKKNSGYETALNTGFHEAIEVHNADGVITMDADGEHSVESLQKFKSFLIQDRIPLVLGTRESKNRLVEYLIGWYFRKVYGISDIFCGMKGYQSSVWKVRKQFDKSNSVGTELALSCVRGGLEFREVFVTGKTRKDKSRFGVGLRGSFRLIFGVIKALSSKPIYKSDL